jgi:hypothetical protein
MVKKRTKEERAKLLKPLKMEEISDLIRKISFNKYGYVYPNPEKDALEKYLQENVNKMLETKDPSIKKILDTDIFVNGIIRDLEDENFDFYDFLEREQKDKVESTRLQNELGTVRNDEGLNLENEDIEQVIDNTRNKIFEISSRANREFMNLDENKREAVRDIYTLYNDNIEDTLKDYLTEKAEGFERKLRTGSSEEDLSRLTVKELKDRLKKSGLKVSGKKDELINRLKKGKGREASSSQPEQPVQPSYEVSPDTPVPEEDGDVFENRNDRNNIFD